ncbi:MAG: hypothetical protein ACQESG_04625 [Nanobdellota archaeon]
MRHAIIALSSGIIGGIVVTEVLRHYIFFSLFIGIPFAIAISIIVFLLLGMQH